MEATQKRVKELEKEVETAARRASAASTRDVLAEAREVNGVKVITQRLDPADGKAYRALADQLRDKLGSGVVVVWGEKDGKGLVLVGATKDIVARGFSAAEGPARGDEGSRRLGWGEARPRTVWRRRPCTARLRGGEAGGLRPRLTRRGWRLPGAGGVVGFHTRRLGNEANPGHL